MTKYYVNEIAKEYRPKRLVRYPMDNRNKEIINNRVAFGLPQ